MNVPNLPTDSLYKFMALSGIVICLFLLVFYWLQLFRLEQESIELGTELSLLEAEITSLELESDLLESEISELQNDLINEFKQFIDSPVENESSGPPAPGVLLNLAEELERKFPDIEKRPAELERRLPEFERRLSEATKKDAELREKSTDITKLHIKLRGKFDQLSSISSLLRLHQIVIFGLASLGLVISIAGFWLWYVRIQQYQDQILTNQASQLSTSASDEDPGTTDSSEQGPGHTDTSP